MQDAIDIKVLQTLIPERKRHGYRSAGACPPRTFDPNEKRLGYRSAGALGCHTRIREGFPCDLSAETRNVRSPRGPGRFLLRPVHGEGQALALRGRMSLLCKFIPCSTHLPHWRTQFSQKREHNHPKQRTDDDANQ